ncbi:DUF2497 domain-containing protein [Phenylobacterium kunshanense]|uniref:DUF2497 domain-containing protein n=1 Tax=Phenylobacterium kunshanense TaxID=1445034 RepID=A0A328BPF4_9CAUL|nr:DUF2497 domain-containing protein [Phenylobacterium kunshanense]RAK68489.1 DUF2497 domain-containing protein [Phenylobacterium kunshanense]
MSEQSSQEPTMEEILASIRRIISEDEAPAGEAPAGPEIDIRPEPVPEHGAPVVATPEPEPERERAAAAPAADEDEDDGDLELTQKVETHGDLDFVDAAPPPADFAPEPAPAPMAEAPPPLAPPGEGLVSEPVAAVAAAAFGRLSSNILMPAEGRTLEDVVRELLRPLLQQWLDDNLPGIVQTAVEAEVERIARGRVR